MHACTCVCVCAIIIIIVVPQKSLLSLWRGGRAMVLGMLPAMGAFVCVRLLLHAMLGEGPRRRRCAELIHTCIIMWACTHTYVRINTRKRRWFLSEEGGHLRVGAEGRRVVCVRQGAARDVRVHGGDDEEVQQGGAGGGRESQQ